MKKGTKRGEKERQTDIRICFKHRFLPSNLTNHLFNGLLSCNFLLTKIFAMCYTQA